MQPLDYHFTTEAELAAFAARLAGQLPAAASILLQGDLGAGKSSFARAFIRARCGQADLPVPSPTFTLVEAYDSPQGQIFHADLYRLNHRDELAEIDLLDHHGRALLLIEWPDRLDLALPNALRLEIRITATGRHLRLTPPIYSALLLAAGLGTRMRPLSDNCPKPLLQVGGRSMLDHALTACHRAGIIQQVVNLHYLPEQITAALAHNQHITFSDERQQLLETGGGVRHALPLLGDYFYTINADMLWQDGSENSLHRLQRVFDPAMMDALLLLQPLESAIGFAGKGDFFLLPDGRLQRRGDAAAAPYVFAGITLTAATLYQHAPPGAYSQNILWDQALAAGRLYGLVHDGRWFHVGTPDDLALANQLWHSP